MTDQNSIQKVDSVKALVTNEFFKTQISEALPGQVSLKRFMRCLFTQVQKNPKLLACSPDSVRASAISCAQMGVEPNGRDAHLIPYGKECTLIIDYKGLVKLAQQSGEISYLHADVVCERDLFIHNKGQIEKHIIDYKKPRGDVYAVYALAHFKDGSEKAEVMHLEEVDAIRKRSKAGQSGPWVTDYNEMAKKTAFRRLSKWLPLSPEIFDRITAEDESSFVDNNSDEEIGGPAFMQQEEEDDVPMGDFVDVETETVEEPAPAPKKKTAKKKSASKPKPAVEEPDHIKRIRLMCEADNVKLEQLQKFCKERGLALESAEDCERMAEHWPNLKDDLKLIEL